MSRLEVMHVLCDLAGGGAERLVLNLCRFADPGVRPTVWTVHTGGALAPAFERAGVEVRSAGRTRRGPGGIALARLIAAARRADVVHTHLWAGDTWGGAAAMAAGVPWVRTEHNTRAEALWRQRLTSAMARGAAAEVCVSEGAAARFPGARVIYNGVDLAPFTPRPAPRGPVRRVLGLGRLTHQKGFDVLVQAARAAGLEVELAGEGDEAATLAAAGAHLLGWVEDVRPVLAEADVLAIPSRWEGFGLVAVEAMAAGVPIVASDVPGLREVVEGAALLVPPGDVAALSAALTRLSADEGLRAALVEAGLRRCERFDIRRTARSYEDLYREVASRHKRV